MAMKLYKPTTPGRRGMSVIDYSVLSKVEPEKSLLAPLNKKAGRNSYGRITVRHRGGGNRRKYRIIDFKRNKFDVPGTVVSIEYDPNRSAHIALLQYEDGEKRYIVAPQGLSVGDVVTSGTSADIKPGNALPLANIPTGTFIHNVELYPGKGAQLARSAGTMAQLMGKENNLAMIRLPSGEMRYVPLSCMATIGQVGNVEHENVKIGKAGTPSATTASTTVSRAAPAITPMAAVKASPPSAVPVLSPRGASLLWVTRPARRITARISSSSSAATASKRKEIQIYG